MTLDVCCNRCGRAFKEAAAFCARCGKPRVEVATAINGLRIVLTFFLAMLAVQAALLVYSKLNADLFTAIVIGTIALTLVTLAFAVPNHGVFLAAYLRAGFSWRGYALVLVIAPILLALVCGYVHGISVLFGIHLERELAVFDGHSLWWPVLLVGLAAPITEELAFRGIIYGRLRDSLGLTECFLISSFAFAILHLALPSLVTHLPLGLYLCWLRHRSNSLWPPTLAHACHNLGVLGLEWLEWA